MTSGEMDPVVASIDDIPLDVARLRGHYRKVSSSVPFDDHIRPGPAACGGKGAGGSE
ncbi:hypothetical protein [Sphingomonas abietis]|uniref:Uncharacterized protein n=1 Tax=Sphingomonas abietis TaxID=3012344 RepID=A0ABY7NV09_9SPHN|nr:hypothetical protein [Sphingomonas abietis]WBO24725.1 hypothetical protein PBT88_17730 [Sphingomonas abietis]